MQLDPRIDTPKTKEFKDSRVAKDVNNFMWYMEQYFRATGAMKVTTNPSQLGRHSSRSFN